MRKEHEEELRRKRNDKQFKLWVRRKKADERLEKRLRALEKRREARDGRRPAWVDPVTPRSLLDLKLAAADSRARSGKVRVIYTSQGPLKINTAKAAGDRRPLSSLGHNEAVLAVKDGSGKAGRRPGTARPKIFC